MVETVNIPPAEQRTRAASADRSEISGFGHAHAKVILMGEHTVVHGAPAIAIPLPTLLARAFARPYRSDIDSRSLSDGHFRFVAGSADHQGSGPQIAVEAAMRQWGITESAVEVIVECDIPVARGLGSSAACAGAAVRAVADFYGKVLDPGKLYDFVQCGEQVSHGRASGIDASAVLASAPIWFHQGVARPVYFGVDAALVIADTGVPGRTDHAVAGVRRALDRDPVLAERLIGRASGLVHAAAIDLAAGRAEPLGLAMLDFQELLFELGVSSPEIENLVVAALCAGADGAKLTGAGMGGCVLALASIDSAPAVSAALRCAGAVQTWTVHPHHIC
ncbi:mevalonate kinase [Nocardia halotolerans]|uniref:mevalonate kinase n=1 Tax=Nocardia halotolerans TaxID=1755878 RepID=A0ABV8VLB7_9NOCA